jgi:hypothetical protein
MMIGMVMVIVLQDHPGVFEALVGGDASKRVIRQQFPDDGNSE